jgi:hypothetical protein
MKTENLINAHDLKCCHGDGVLFTNNQFKKCSCRIGRTISLSYVQDLNDELILNNLWAIKRS